MSEDVEIMNKLKEGTKLVAQLQNIFDEIIKLADKRGYWTVSMKAYEGKKRMGRVLDALFEIETSLDANLRNIKLEKNKSILDFSEE